MSLVGLQIIGQFALVAQACVINYWDTGNPVAMFEFATALNIVLTACEIPHEITPIHKIALVGEEETDVLQLCRNLDGHRFSATVIRHVVAVYAAHPVFVSLCMCTTVHAWEEHILGIYVFIFVRNDEIRILLVGIFLRANSDPLAG